jgi:hypothetical protein
VTMYMFKFQWIQTEGKESGRQMVEEEGRSSGCAVRIVDSNRSVAINRPELGAVQWLWQ